MFLMIHKFYLVHLLDLLYLIALKKDCQHLVAFLIHHGAETWITKIKVGPSWLGPAACGTKQAVRFLYTVGFYSVDMVSGQGQNYKAVLSIYSQ